MGISDRDRHTGTSLADALFTSTQQRLLALLFGQPDRSFFATQLIELAQAGRGAVQRELRSLAESGLVTVSPVGNQKHYQANPNSPVFEDLRNIVLKTIGLHDPIRRALEPLKDRIELATLFGSVAKGVDTAWSDIDLLIVSDDLTLEEVYAALGPAESQLCRRINPALFTPAELESRRKSDSSFLTRVLDSKNIVIVGDHVG